MEDSRRDSASASPVHVMHVVFALQSGGMEHGVVKIANGLDRAAVTTSICSTTPADPGMRSLLAPDVPVFELSRRPGNDQKVVWELYRLFRRERPHIVHTHAWGTLLEGWAAARLARVPLLVHGEHGTLQLRPRQVRAQRWGWRRPDHLLSVSSRLAEKMAREIGFPAERITVIRNGVDLSRFRPADETARAEARRALGLGQGPVIGTVGRLVDVKDHAGLLEAFAILKRQGLVFEGAIAGDGPLRADLEQKITTLGLTGFVRLLGHRPDVETVFAALDVFCLPSKSEGMSNTILEAMASGLAVVATRVGGADELVVDPATGALVPPRDPDALAEGLARCLEDPCLRQSQASAARERAIVEFSLEGMIRNYERLYAALGHS